MEKGWIRFIDKMPIIGEKIIVAYSLAVYNGRSFRGIGYLTIENKIKDLFTKPTPIYDNKNFDCFLIENFNCYAHHWAYLDDINKNIKIEEVSESIRRRKGLKHPIKLNSKK
jgi:hypothetical protein